MKGSEMLKRCLRCDLLHGPSSVRCDHCGHPEFREVRDPLDRRATSLADWMEQDNRAMKARMQAEREELDRTTPFPDGAAST